MADTLATLQDLADALQIPLADLSVAAGTLALQRATARVQRAAGGQRIVDVTDTAVIPAPYDDVWLELPQLPVRSVAAVAINGATVTDWVLIGQRLWRAVGWMTRWSPPSEVAVTSSHGYTAGSQWLELGRDMCLSLAVQGYGNPTAVQSEAIDDYRVTYAEVEARMQMTESMRQAIADAYGTSAYATSSR